MLPSLIKENCHLLYSMDKVNTISKVLFDRILALLLDAFKFRNLVFAVKLLFLLLLLFVFLVVFFNERSRQHCNEAWHYVIQ